MNFIFDIPGFPKTYIPIHKIVLAPLLFAIFGVYLKSKGVPEGPKTLRKIFEFKWRMKNKKNLSKLGGAKSHVPAPLKQHNIMPKIPHSTNCIVCLSHFCTLFDCFAMHCTQGQVGSCWHFRVLWHVGVGKKPVSAKFKTFIGNKVVEWLSLWSYKVKPNYF